MKARGLTRDPLAARKEMAARANEALGLDMPPLVPPRVPAPPVVAPPPPPAPPAAPASRPAVKQRGESPAAPQEPPAASVERPAPAEQPASERRRIAKGARTGTYGNPYERLDGVRTAKVSFQASLEFFQELRRFEAELPPKTRNEWMENALRQAMARSRKRWQKAAEARAAGELLPTEDDED
jgi:hypothetical protein